MQTSLMIVDNFYNNPMGVRNLALSKDFADMKEFKNPKNILITRVHIAG